MGVGRRMKKQGPPEPLDEAHFTKLKRMAGMSVAESRSESHQFAKKRRTNEGKKKGEKKEIKKIKKDSNIKQVKKFRNALVPKRSDEKPKIVKAIPQSESDHDTLEDGSYRDSNLSTANKVIESDFEGLSGEDINEGIKDDFLESESDVYDSADDHNNKGKTFSEDEDESDAEEKLSMANIAGLSRKLDEQLAEEAAEAEAELQEAVIQTNIIDEHPQIFSDSEDESKGIRAKALLAPDMQLLRTRITDTIRVLENFLKLAEKGRSRAEYISQLLKDICSYYGYSFYLAEKLFDLFPVKEAFAFFEANESPRPVVIRTNTLRTHRRDLAQALMNRGVTLEPVGKWSKVGLQIFESTVPLGATPEYLAGHYILQAASSFLPVMALAPQEHERILDMAAAPGGKTTHIAALMKNTGCIFANDSNKARAKGLIGNIYRLGAKNVIVCNHDALSFPKVIGGFDRVLLDAPCSGTGVIAKDPSVKTNKNELDFLRLPHLQKQLLLAAIDSVDHGSKTGGYIVYSTCSVTIEENEGVVQYVLKKRPNVKLCETGLVFGRQGFTAYRGKKFDASISMTRRYYPHVHNIDGFFVAKFRKTGPTPKAATAVSLETTNSDRNMNIKRNLLDGKSGKNKRPGDEEAEYDSFGDWDKSEDELYLERARRRSLKRRGLNPKAVQVPQESAYQNSKKNREGLSDLEKSTSLSSDSPDSKTSITTTSSTPPIAEDLPLHDTDTNQKEGKILRKLATSSTTYRKEGKSTNLEGTATSDKLIKEKSKGRKKEKLSL